MVFKTWFVGNLGGDGDRGRLLLLLKEGICCEGDMLIFLAGGDEWVEGIGNGGVFTPVGIGMTRMLAGRL